jgi:hypothetical protein
MAAYQDPNSRLKTLIKTVTDGRKNMSTLLGISGDVEVLLDPEGVLSKPAPALSKSLEPIKELTKLTPIPLYARYPEKVAAMAKLMKLKIPI